VTNNDRDDHGPDYSPDGKRIAYVASDESESGIYTIKVGGGGVINLTDNDTDHHDDYSPDYSPEGRKIVFATYYYSPPGVDDDSSGRRRRNRTLHDRRRRGKRNPNHRPQIQRQFRSFLGEPSLESGSSLRLLERSDVKEIGSLRG
jgi:Tol biopolymer transport system component